MDQVTINLSALLAYAGLTVIAVLGYFIRADMSRREKVATDLALRVTALEHQYSGLTPHLKEQLNEFKLEVRERFVSIQEFKQAVDVKNERLAMIEKEQRELMNKLDRLSLAVENLNKVLVGRDKYASTV